MKTKEKIKYTYTCKYCNTVYEHKVKECASCGAVEFTANSHIVPFEKEKMNPLVKAAIICIAVIIGSAIILAILAALMISADPSQADSSQYKSIEYSYDTVDLDDENMFLGKKYESMSTDYYTSIKITGKFNELHENIFDNVYSSQFQSFCFDIPCNIELKGESYSIDITNLNFCYFGSANCSIYPKVSASGDVDGEISMYLIDADGNKNKLLINKYSRDKYSAVEDYLFSDEYSKEFEIDRSLEKYSSLLIEVNGEAQTFELDYDRGSGYIEYYGMK